MRRRPPWPNVLVMTFLSVVARLVRSRPLGAMLAWFFTVGQGLAFAPLYLDTPVAPHWFIFASNFVGLLVPTVVITYVVDGADGVRSLWRRATAVRVPARMYVIGLVVMPLLAIGLAVTFLGAPDVSGTTIAAGVWNGLIVSTIVGLLLNNLWEEVAWTGFVQARLQQRHSALAAAALTAPLFALQHLVLFAQNGLFMVVIMLAGFTLVSIPFRAFNGWLYNRTGSLFLVGLVHALSNAVGPGAGMGTGFLRRIYPSDADLAGVLHIVALAVIGVVVMTATRGRLGRGGPLPRSQRMHRRDVLAPADVQGVPTNNAGGL